MLAADVRSEEGSSDRQPPHEPTGEEVAADGAAVLAEESDDADEDDQDEVEDDGHIVPEDEPVESGIDYGRRLGVNDINITIRPGAGLDRCHRLADRERGRLWAEMVPTFVCLSFDRCIVPGKKRDES